ILICCGACASAPRSAPPARADVASSLARLVPAGMDALADVDLARLRAWPPSARVLRALPAHAGADHRQRIGFDWIEDVDRIVIAMRRGSSPEVLLLLQGRIDAAAVAEAAERSGEGTVEHRGTLIHTASGHASAMLAGVYVAGRLSDVRATV